MGRKEDLNTAKIERKCADCGRWTNGQKDHCNYCNALINPQKLNEERVKKKLIDLKNRPKSGFEKFIDSIENSPNPLVKAGYYILKVVWVIYFVILTAILYFIAFLPG